MDWLHHGALKWVSCHQCQLWCKENLGFDTAHQRQESLCNNTWAVLKFVSSVRGIGDSSFRCSKSSPQFFLYRSPSEFWLQGWDIFKELYSDLFLPKMLLTQSSDELFQKWPNCVCACYYWGRRPAVRMYRRCSHRRLQFVLHPRKCCRIQRIFASDDFWPNFRCHPRIVHHHSSTETRNWNRTNAPIFSRVPVFFEEHKWHAPRCCEKSVQRVL